MTETPLFRVGIPGLLSTLQDGGRPGFQRMGVPVGGAMDAWACAVANLLLGNSPDAAVLEITLTGPQLSVLRDGSIAICGADLSPTLGGAAVPLWHTFPVRTGQTLRFGHARAGARAYLAAAGGFAVPPVLGSRSTFLRGGWGGSEGRALRSGDILRAYDAPPSPARGLRPADIPRYSSDIPLRLIPGPHDTLFDPDALAAFFSASYTLTPEADRMGYRFAGPPVAARPGVAATLASEAVPMGAVQMPPGGQPLLLMADRQTVGGYPLLGVVIDADLSRAAQMAPGNTARFAPVSLEDAQRAGHSQREFLRLLAGASGR